MLSFLVVLQLLFLLLNRKQDYLDKSLRNQMSIIIPEMSHGMDYDGQVERILKKFLYFTSTDLDRSLLVFFSILLINLLNKI